MFNAEAIAIEWPSLLDPPFHWFYYSRHRRYRRSFFFSSLSLDNRTERSHAEFELARGFDTWNKIRASSVSCHEPRLRIQFCWMTGAKAAIRRAHIIKIQYGPAMPKNSSCCSCLHATLAYTTITVQVIPIRNVGTCAGTAKRAKLWFGYDLCRGQCLLEQRHWLLLRRDTDITFITTS